MTSIEEGVHQPTPQRHSGELLLELLSEEIPARMQRRAIEDLQQSIRERLKVLRVSEGTAVEGYVTPRRLVIIARRVPDRIPGRSEPGPRVGAPAQALEGFLRRNLVTIEQCEIRDTGRGQQYFIPRPDQATKDVLPEIIKSALLGLQWPKSMRWPGTTLRWVRPLGSIICLYDGEELRLEIDGVPKGRTTRGHRFLSPGAFCVCSAAEYLEKLQHTYVILDQDQRRELIRADLGRRASELGVNVKPDSGLLDEVTGLAEFPVVLAGSIDTDFMSLPPEVLQTAMRVHQKYFSCTYPDGRPAPHFLFVVNNLAEDGGKAIIAGNERVLRARLADARFFWDQDRKVRLEDRVEALKERVYHDNLGSMYEKAERMSDLAVSLTDIVTSPVGGVPVDPETVGRAALLAKADLSTGIVGEFPELQGIMGGYYYAEQHRSDYDVANIISNSSISVAISEHYKPLGVNDKCPKAREAVLVALADKIDSLVAFFAISLPPTSSRDPFGLRRAALGVIRIILENGLRLSLKSAFIKGAEIFYVQRNSPNWEERVDPLYTDLMRFVVERLKVHLRAEGVRHDLIAAGFAQAGNAESDLVRLLSRVRALQIFVDTDDGANLLVAYRRASNIVAIEEHRDRRRYHDPVDEGLFCLEEEQTLWQRLTTVSQRLRTELDQEFFESAMIALSQLRGPIDEFFDKVTVNTVEPAPRENRLRLLAQIRDTMNQVADFSLIEG
jgi:glycyl-tRNA synthetase beta chain